MILLDGDNIFNIEVEEKRKMLHFGAVMFEQVWLLRNKVKMGGMMPNWDEVVDCIRRLNKQYWLVGES